MKNALLGVASVAGVVGVLYVMKQKPSMSTELRRLSARTVSPGDRIRATVFGSWTNSPTRNVYWVAEFADLGGAAQWHGKSPLKTISGSGSDTNNCPDKYATGENSGHVQDTGDYGLTRIRTYLLDADTGEILGEAFTDYIVEVVKAASYSTSFQGWAQ